MLGLGLGLYAGDLMLTAKTKEDVEILFSNSKQPMEKKVLRANVDKAKITATVKTTEGNIKVGRCPCGTCGSGVGVNSILYNAYDEA